MDTMTTQSASNSAPPAVVSEPQKPNRRKGGRPKLLPEEHRRNIYKLGYTDSQNDKLIARADAAGLGEVELIRRLSLDLEIKTIPVANRQAIIELNAIGRNVNQVARKLNQGAVPGISAELVKTWLSEVNRSIAAAGKSLVRHD